jgi:hypothetical protein
MQRVVVNTKITFFISLTSAPTSAPGALVSMTHIVFHSKYFYECERRIYILDIFLDMRVE